jgi:hypothetical protein
MHLVVAFFIVALPIALAMTGLSYLLTAGKRRKERAWRAQLVENGERATADALQQQRERDVREEARQRQMIERAVRFGPNYNSRMPFDD